MPDFFYDKRLYYTPIEFAISHIGRTWEIPILWRLQEKPLRFNELKKDIPYITDKMPIQELRALENKGLLNREVFAVVPPKVEYSLTEKGKRTIPIIETIMKYGCDLIKEAGIEFPPNEEK